MADRKEQDMKVVIIGAGPAGLTAAYELSRFGVNSVIFEKDSVVGGLARTVHYNGYHFDIGGHRFFTKVKPVETMWNEILGDNFLHRNRLSRIYYNGKFFHYPLRVTNVLLRLGLFNSTLMLLSYLRSLLLPIKNERSFEDWISNRFGKRLFRTFFKAYTEKVWGIPCNELSADWAAQRIKGLSLMTALKKALLGQKVRNDSEIVRTLIDSFHYPKLGPGMMWEIVSKKVQENGCDLKMEANVEKILWSSRVVEALVISVNDKKQMVTGTHFISSMPMRELIQKFEPQPPAGVLKAASELDYRDFLIVALIVNKKDLFPDNWIYIHDPNVKVGRIQNFKNWSPYMVPDPEKSCIGLEYFCFEGDGLWKMPDEKLFELAKYELESLRLAQAVDVEDGVVVRMPKAYPVYDDTYRQNVFKIREFLKDISNIQLVGRNGMHKYNNQDHSMLTAMLASKNLLGGNYDLWGVNVEEDYHEGLTKEGIEAFEDYAAVETAQPLVPVRLKTTGKAEVAIAKAFARMDKLAFAVSTGIVLGLYILLATIWLLVKDGSVVGPNLALLGQYFIGFTVSYRGAFIGLLYGFFWGFTFGWLFAYLRNLTIGFYLYVFKRRSEIRSLRSFLDFI